MKNKHAEYEIKREQDGYNVIKDGSPWSLRYASESPKGLGIFAGVQFEEQSDHSGWCMATSAFVKLHGSIGPYDAHGEQTPATPVRARFILEEGK